MTPQPLVSVLIPAFNAETTIRRAMDSALRQSYRPIEILVMDDGSSDSTTAIVRSYPNAEIRLFSNPVNVGQCTVLNQGIRNARGEFVAFLDADDEWSEDKIAKQVQLIARHPDMSFVTCGCLFVSDFGPAPYEFGLDLHSTNPREIWRKLLAATYIAKPCVLARRSALDRVGPFDPALRVAEDQDMWIRLALEGEVGLVPEVLVKAHDTPNSLTEIYATRTADFVIPMIARHLEHEKSRLSVREINEIWGERYSTVGRVLYSNGATWRGLMYLFLAITKGHRVGQNIWYIVTASWPSRRLKAALSAAIREKPPRSEGRQLNT